MKRFCVAVIAALAGCVMAGTVLAADPNDPLNKPDMQCTSLDHDNFCGIQPDHGDGCFARVASAGCGVILNGSPMCAWRLIKMHITPQNVDGNCGKQKAWAQRNHYTDAGEVYQTCKTYQHHYLDTCH